MARYIDAEKAHKGIEAIQTSLESNNDEIWQKYKPYYKGLAMARGVINETPTADVAPRAEVAREIFEEIEKTLNRKIRLRTPEYESLEESFEKLSDCGHSNHGYLKGVISTCEDLLDLLDELKKKHAEGENG